MNYAKITGNKYFKIAAVIILPTILVAGYYGGKFLKDKYQKKKIDAELEKMKDKYAEINSVEDFLEGVKYLENTNEAGYNLLLLHNKQEELKKMGMDNLKKFYELSKISKKNDKEYEEWLDLIHMIYP